MKKANFNTLKNLPVPEKWLENALAVPEKEREKPPVPLFRRRAAAAAAIILVSALSVALAFSLRKEPVIVAPFAEESSAPSEAAVSPSQPTESVPVSDGVEPSQGTGATEPVSATVPGAYSETRPAVTDPSNAPSASEPVPTQPVHPTQSVEPTEPVRPTAPPQTEPPRPTEAPAPTDPPEPPTVTPYDPPSDCEIYGMFSLNTVSGSGYNTAEDLSIFCRLYDSGGRLVGDSPLYHPQREATILSRFDDGTILAYYDPIAEGLSITEGVYEYVFYDLHDNELYRDVKYVF